MLIKDDVLRQVTARTLRVKEEDLTPEIMLEADPSGSAGL